MIGCTKSWKFESFIYYQYTKLGGRMENMDTRIQHKNNTQNPDFWTSLLLTSFGQIWLKLCISTQNYIVLTFIT